MNDAMQSFVYGLLRFLICGGHPSAVLRRQSRR